ncbi:MAG: MFS transporter [Acidobacteriia bacterium]|nr:MFS transporter [Terriglobia bacterium]
MNFLLNRKPRLFFILVAAFLNSVGYGIIAPVFPRLVELLGRGGASQAGYYYTLLIATFSATQFLFAPIMGKLSDRFGRRPLLMIAIAGLGVQYVIAATTNALSWLFVAEVIAGASGGSIVAIGAYVADVTPPEKRGRSFGTVWGIAAVGRMVGPLIGGLLSGNGYRLAFWAAGMLTLFNLLHTIFLVPESLPEGPREPLTWKNYNPFAFVGPLKHIHVPFGLMAGFLLSICAISAAQPVAVLFMQARLGWGVKYVGLYMTLNAVATVLGQIVLTRALTPVMDDKRSLYVALVVRTIGWFLTAFVAVSWHMYAVLIFAVLGSVVQPLMGAFISRIVSTASQGELQGVMTRLSVVAEAIGPVLGGAVFRYSTAPGSSFNMPGLAFIMCAILGLATFLYTRSALAAEPAQESALSVQES